MMESESSGRLISVTLIALDDGKFPFSIRGDGPDVSSKDSWRLSAILNQMTDRVTKRVKKKLQRIPVARAETRRNLKKEKSAADT